MLQLFVRGIYRSFDCFWLEEGDRYFHILFPRRKRKSCYFYSISSQRIEQKRKVVMEKNINLLNYNWIIYIIILLNNFWLKLQKICPMLWRTSVHLAVKSRKKLPTKLSNSWSITNQKCGFFSKQNMIQQGLTGNIIFRIELKKNLIKLSSWLNGISS